MPKTKKVSSGCFMGVDPGKHGGMALLCGDDLEYCPMPTTERGIWDWFESASLVRLKYAMIERVHAMPKQGVTSSFNFGVNYGLLRMALIASYIPFQEVSPRVWQKSFGISPRKPSETKTQWKDRLRGKAQQLFPDLPLWDDCITNQRAICDAILIAEYCRRTIT